MLGSRVPAGSRGHFELPTSPAGYALHYDLHAPAGVQQALVHGKHAPGGPRQRRPPKRPTPQRPPRAAQHSDRRTPPRWPGGGGKGGRRGDRPAAPCTAAEPALLERFSARRSAGMQPLGGHITSRQPRISSTSSILPLATSSTPPPASSRCSRHGSAAPLFYPAPHPSNPADCQGLQAHVTAAFPKRIRVNKSGPELPPPLLLPSHPRQPPSTSRRILLTQAPGAASSASANPPLPALAVETPA